jgi:hypothetical protein
MGEFFNGLKGWMISYTLKNEGPRFSVKARRAVSPNRTDQMTVRMLMRLSKCRSKRDTGKEKTFLSKNGLAMLQGHGGLFSKTRGSGQTLCRKVPPRRAETLINPFHGRLFMAVSAGGLPPA